MHTHTLQEGEIHRDIARTFPLEPLFRESAGVGQNLLANVLKACLAFHDDVGYCQGMNYVAATFLFALRRKLLPPSPFTHRPPQGRRAHLHPAEAFPLLDHSIGGSDASTGDPNAGPKPSMVASEAAPSAAGVSPPRGSGSQQQHDDTTTTDEEGEDGYHTDQSEGSEALSPSVQHRGSHEKAALAKKASGG